MKARWSPVSLLILALLGYIGVRLLSPLELPMRITGAVMLAVLYLLLPRSWWIKEGRSPWVVMVPWVAMGFFSWLLVLTLARDASVFALWLATLPDQLHEWVPFSALGILVVTPLITLVGYFMARRTAPVIEIDIPVKNLPAALQGFTIAQISDIHVGPTIKRDFVEAIVRRVNRLDADMVAITGDVVDGTVHDLAPHTAPLADLRSRHGTYVVTGNHEYYSGAHAWIGELRRLGTRVLMNEHVVLEHDGAQLAVAGVTDFSAHHFDHSHRSDPHAAMAGLPESTTKVLLAHQPRSAPSAEQAGYHLQLSGHTHGGQFWPWNFFVRLQQPWTGGLNKIGKMWVYINRGTGYWGPPMRFGIPSEITRIRLVAAT